MAVLRFAGFAGENRALEPKLLADTVCTVSRNQKPGRGDLRPWKTPNAVATLPTGRQTIYRMGRDVASDTQYWLSWNTVVHAIRGFSSDDTTEQTFYTGDGAPKFTNNVIGLATAPFPTTSRPMGLPAPTTAPIAVGVDAAVVNLGKYDYIISEDVVNTLTVGEKWRVQIGEDTTTYQYLTLVAGTGGVVTKASLAAQLDALNGITATVVTATTDTAAGVKVLSDTVGVNFIIAKKIGTESTYDATKVTYANYASASGGASTAASIVLSSAQIAAMAVQQHFQVTVNTDQPVSAVVYGGSGSFPAAVTADTVQAAFMAVPGLNADIGYEANGVSRKVTVTTKLTGSSTSINIKTITPGTVDSYQTYVSGVRVDDQSAPTSYYYVYTYANDLGWESAPSPASQEVVRGTLGTTTLSSFASPPSGNYNITTVRIYRTQTGSNTNFYFLREVAVGTGSTTDDNRDLGELLETTTWLPAPGVPTGGSLNMTEPNLTNLTAMWNGMMAGISGNAVRVCESYVPYAWPKAFEVIPPDSKPVALGVFGQNLLVLTTGRPLLVNGSSPDGLDQQKIEMPQACVAARSVVGMGAGVAWASEDGLCWFGAGGPRILTAGLMLREDWQALVPSSIIGQMYEGLYFGSYDDGSGRKGFFIDPNNPQGIWFLDTGYSTMYFDELRDHLYVLDGTSIKKWDTGNSTMTYRVVSKVWKQPYPQNYAAAEVIASAYPVTFKLYADGLLRHTQTVTSRNPFRLPAGFRAFDYQIELEGTAPVQGVAIASSMQELSAV